jgi:hypothetical protein
MYEMGILRSLDKSNYSTTFDATFRLDLGRELAGDDHIWRETLFLNEWLLYLDSLMNRREAPAVDQNAGSVERELINVLSQL